jgi:hypothetical protein
VASRTFNKGVPKATKTDDAIDIAARFFVYKLYDAKVRQLKQWHVFHEIGEKPATMSRAVEPGWVVGQKQGYRLCSAGWRPGASSRRPRGRRLAPALPRIAPLRLLTAGLNHCRKEVIDSDRQAISQSASYSNATAARAARRP